MSSEGFVCQCRAEAIAPFRTDNFGEQGKLAAVYADALVFHHNAVTFHSNQLNRLTNEQLSLHSFCRWLTQRDDDL